MPSTPRIFEFGDFILHLGRGELSRGGRQITLPPKAYETLAYLVGHAGQLVSKQELLDAVWPDVMVEENNLEQQIFQLRKILGKTSIETVARRGYRFELTVKVSDAVIPAPPVAHRPAPGGRALWILAGAAAAMATIVAMGLRWESRRPPLERIHSLAVLPFQPLSSADATDEAMGLGLADAVITRLGGAPGLTVRPTLAVSRFAGGGGAQSPAAAGRTLRVDAVLQTTFRRDGDEVRVRAQLVDVRTDAAVWTAQFDVAAGELSQLEDAIAAELALHLGSELGPGRTAPRARVEPAAHAAYVQGRWHWSRRNARDLAEAERSFREALTLEPEYAPAQAGLAAALLSQGGRHDEARAAAEQAIRLDEGLGEPHAVLGFLAFFQDRDSLRAQSELARAVELNASDATAYQWLAFVHVARRRCAQARAAIARAQELDPASSTINTDLAHIDFYCGDFAAAEREVRAALRLDPSFAQAYAVLGAVLTEQARYDEAREAFETLARLGGPAADIALVEIDARAGNAEAAGARLDQARRVTPELQGYAVARVLSLLGRHEEAVAALDRADQERESTLMLVAVDPAAFALRAEPRVQALIRRLGLG